jgi:hypothetical protein
VALRNNLDASDPSARGIAMTDIKSTRLLYIKGMLFLALGFISAALLLLEHFSIERLVLLLVCIWAFSRAYYFAFYVVEHYADENYRFAGLFDFFKYAIGHKGGSRRDQDSEPS